MSPEGHAVISWVAAMSRFHLMERGKGAWRRRHASFLIFRLRSGTDIFCSILLAPCCDKLYTCRLCHDNNEDHQLDRFKVKEVQCINCEKIQHAQQSCEECSTLFGEYYCSICHLFDKDKKQYHCENCGICRIGPKEDFFHCLKCNLCLAMNLQGKHKCIENVSRQNCPICLEDIHTSRVVAHVLPCGHLLHRTCYEEMLKEGYRCPLCMHSALDMTRYWRQLDDEVAQTPMPSEYQNMTVDDLSTRRD
ncbi:RING finger and CHY zinc finger domain-containing protein 1 isoform X9 [Canis lupus dingo]|uniref:RING finger and CHY zinc finger domain-containing protein 1 isoform X9 n=1 Tax=Canis lupus dingo TaxID=286419 RepID=UPI000274A15B|nr:RING finger and CHY zinc finger domain-containing protein 1 isoform X9 [Canis lupus dingo]